MITNLKNTPTGKKLYDILVSLLTAEGKGLDIEYLNPPPPGYQNYDGVFGISTTPDKYGIVMFNTNLDVFFEEMTHALQIIHSPHELNGVELKGNKELEAKIMRYEFAVENGIQLNNEPFYIKLYDYVNGKATFSEAVQAMGRLGYPSSQFTYNESAFHTNNRAKLKN